MVARVYDLSVQKVGTERYKVQDQPWMHSEILLERRVEKEEGRERGMNK